MKRITLIVLAFFLLIYPSLSQDKQTPFDAEATWSYIKDLASPSMLGRKSGQPGGVMAEQYIASKFEKWGLHPAGKNGTYFQEFTIEHRHVEPGVVFKIDTNKEKREFYYGEDWRVGRYSGSGHFMAEIVFVGYGIHAPDKGYDDYAQVEVDNKVVLFSTGVPEKLKSKLEEKTKMTKRIEAAQKKGALGAIIFSSSSDSRHYFRLDVEKENYDPDFVILTVEDNIIDFIFKYLPTEPRPLFSQIKEELKPASLETGVKSFVSVEATFDEKRSTRNVLAKIPGTDPQLKNEYVIIGGHMDHLGLNPHGEVMNGANDNASGTAVTMEIARAMNRSQAKPKRTVVFALWAAEEQGLLGSRHYADHPLYPVENTVAYINLDMVGHGRGKIPFMGVYYAPQIWELLQENLPQNIMDYVKPDRGGPGGSDHTPFLMKGVPGFFLITRGAIKYHHPRDDSDLINPEMLKKVGDLAYQAVKILANEPGDYIPPLRQENFYLKYQNLINYELAPLNKFIANHKNVENPYVDLQLTILHEEEALSGDELRMSVLKNFLAGREKIEQVKGLSYYSDSGSFSRNIRQGKTTVLCGLKGLETVQDFPQWGQVMAKQGIRLVVAEEVGFLFNQEGLSQEGKNTFQTLNTSGLLLGFKGLDEQKAKVLLKNSKRPILLLQDELPSPEVMDLVKKKESALGLILTKEDQPSSYFEKLNKAKKSLGTEHLMVVNEQCLWGKPGKEQMLEVISQMVKADYERNELRDIFSSTLLNLLKKVKGRKDSSEIPFHPF